MKRTKLLLTSLVLSAAVLAGCGSSAEAGHFGFGGVATFKTTAPNYTKAGVVQTDINYASFLLGKDGKIKQLRLDVVQIKVSPNEDGSATVNTGKTVGNAGADTRSKWELLTEYNMAGTSPIGKEWYEQAEAFENLAVGKTVAELVALEATDGYMTGDKAAAGVTIHINGFIDAIERADANKVAVADVKGLQVGVGGVGTHAAFQSNYTIAAAAFKADKTVVSARMDVYQIPYVAVAPEGLLLASIGVNATKAQVVAGVTPGTGSIKSKHDLGAAYGMAGSATKGEWFEQANKITAYMVGKTVSVALEVGENQHLVNEVAADVTIKAVDYLNAFLEAEDTSFNARA